MKRTLANQLKNFGKTLETTRPDWRFRGCFILRGQMVGMFSRDDDASFVVHPNGRLDIDLNLCSDRSSTELSAEEIGLFADFAREVKKHRTLA